jgi:hypothetical protein
LFQLWGLLELTVAAGEAKKKKAPPGVTAELELDFWEIQLSLQYSLH